MFRLTAAALLALSSSLAAAQESEIVPLAEKMKQGMPTHYALVRCAAIAQATSDWIVETEGSSEISDGLSRRAVGFERAAANAAEGADVAVATFAGEWTDRFAASGRPGGRAWRADPLWAKDMQLCDEIAAVATQ